MGTTQWFETRAIFVGVKELKYSLIKYLIYDLEFNQTLNMINPNPTRSIKKV